MTNNTILETSYECLSDHIIILTVVQKRLKIIRFEVKIYGTAETADNESVSDKQCYSAMLHPLKQSEITHQI